MASLIAYQDNEKIVLIDGTTIEIDTGMFNDPLGFIVTEAIQQGGQACYCCRERGGCQEGCRCWQLLPEEARR